MYVEFKVTTWERVQLPKDLSDEKVKEIVEKLDSGEIRTSDDLHQSYPESHYHVIVEAETQMSVEENDGWATIEAYDETGEALFANGKH